MGEDVYIVPTILTDNPQVFLTQLNAYQQFAKRIQVDLMDGTFTSTRSLPESAIAQLPPKVAIDIHLMTAKPSDHLQQILRLNPRSVFYMLNPTKTCSPFLLNLKKLASSPVLLCFQVLTLKSSSLIWMLLITRLSLLARSVSKVDRLTFYRWKKLNLSASWILILKLAGMVALIYPTFAPLLIPD